MESMTLGRWISLLIASAFIGFDVYLFGVQGIYASLFYLLLPMACIWFGDELGELTNIGLYLSGGVPISQSTPGRLVRFVGWLVLLVFFSMFVIWPILRKMSHLL